MGADQRPDLDPVRMHLSLRRDPIEQSGLQEQMEVMDLDLAVKLPASGCFGWQDRQAALAQAPGLTANSLGRPRWTPEVEHQQMMGDGR